MSKTIDEMLLDYATKSKNFIAELATQTRENYFSAETRVPIKILTDYYKIYKQLPSFEVACEYGRNYPNYNQTKEILKRSYESNKSYIQDGDFPFLVDKLKRQYNDIYIKERIKYLAQTLNNNYDLDNINEYLKKTTLEISSLKERQLHAQGGLHESAQQRLLEYKEIKANPYLGRGILSGLKDLDAITNGFKGGELILISGPSGSGKSIFLMNMAINAWLGSNRINMPSNEWKDDGKNIWFITIENPKKLLERRVDANLAGVYCNNIRDGKLNDTDELLFRQVLRFQNDYGKFKRFHISDFTRGVSPAMIEVEYEKVCRDFEPDMIVIDYLGLMKATDPTGVDWMDQGSCAADLHELARIINKPILTASQLKAAMRTHNGPKQIIGDPESVARSKMITDNVNLNLQIEKTPDFNVSTYVKVHIAKNRDGETGKALCFVKEFWRMRVCDAAEELIMPDGDEINE